VADYIHPPALPEYLTVILKAVWSCITNYSKTLITAYFKSVVVNKNEPKLTCHIFQNCCEKWGNSVLIKLEVGKWLNKQTNKIFIIPVQTLSGTNLLLKQCCPQ